MQALVGETPGAQLILAAAGLDIQKVGRYRDCYVNKDGELVVFTRNGGGNREDYEDATEYMRGFPGFVRDYDDDFDCTYAYYVFRLDEGEFTPEMMQTLYERTTKITGTPMERFHASVARMKSNSQ